MTWDVITSTDMPPLVLALIWNLILSYSMFGIVPTVVYYTGLGRTLLHGYRDPRDLLATYPSFPTRRPPDPIFISLVSSLPFHRK